MLIVYTKFISIVLLVFGCVLILRPKRFKAILELQREGNRAYIGAVIKTLTGMIFLIVASSCSIPWIVFLFGLLLAAGGIVVFVLKKQVVYKILDWWENKTNKQLKLAGTVFLLMGVLLSLAI